MGEKDIFNICEKVLERLSKMDYERTGGIATEQLIFPNKFPSKKKEKEILEKYKDNPEKAQENLEKEFLKYTRISEQELRQLFIEEFIKEHSIEAQKLYYSIETPTQNKYKFGKTNDCIKVCREGDKDTGQSALLDMCVFKRVEEGYNRILNIEFKHQNAALKNLTKDVLKLMYEEQNGAFVFLLKNTNSGTLCNKGKTGVLDKLCNSFSKFKDISKDKCTWRGDKDKTIQLIIISLEQKKNGTPTLIRRTIRKDDLTNLEKLFSINKDNSGDITKVSEGSGWKIKPLNNVSKFKEGNAKHEKG